MEDFDKSSIFLTTLKKHPEKYHETVSLIEKCFHYDHKNKFDLDFYPLMNKKNHHQNYIIISKKCSSVIGHLGINIKEMICGAYITKVCLIGGVAIRPDFQKKGIMERLFKNIFDLYTETTSFFILWSNLDDYYQKFHFYQAGAMVQTSHNPSSTFPPTSYQLADLNNTLEISEVKKIFRQTSLNYTSLVRNKSDWHNILKISSCRLYIKKDHLDKVEAYFFYEKGFDFKNIIHEFGSLKQHYHKNLLELTKYHLWRPECDNRILKRSSFLYSALFKISAKKHFSSFIHHWSQGQIKIKGLSQEKVFFSFKKGHYSLNHQEFLQGIFGPHSIKEITGLGPPIYFSGHDSI